MGVFVTTVVAILAGLALFAVANARQNPEVLGWIVILGMFFGPIILVALTVTFGVMFLVAAILDKALRLPRETSGNGADAPLPSVQ